MAFTQNTFATVGAQAAPSPTVYSYGTDDSSAIVAGANYFVDKQGELDEGDLIFANTSDGSFKFKVSADTATATVSSAPANVVIVNSLADFPDPVGGVIELVPSPGAEIVYEIGALIIDVGANVFTCTNGEVVIRGVHRTASNITTSGSGVMFTCSEAAFFCEYIGFNCANADWVDFSASGGFLTLANQNVILNTCQSVGTIAGAFTTSLRTFTLVSSSVGGLTWTGATSSQINISRFLGIGWTGTLLDLGTATFSIISIAGGNRFISPVGTTILSGLTASGNLTATGRGLVNDCLFNGTGTALAGIDPNDLKWSFSGNVFADNTTFDTHVDADTYLSATTTATIVTLGVYVQIGGANWLTEVEDRFTDTTAGALTYIGLERINVDVRANATVEKVGGGTDQICMKVAIDGVVQDKTLVCTENSTPTGVSTGGLFSIVSGQVFTLWVANMDSTANITVSAANMTITNSG